MTWTCKGHRSARHAFFLSYRVSSELELLKTLHPLLERIGKRRKGQPVHFFWDRHCLNEGEDYEMGFRGGLQQSDAVVYFLSRASVDIMAEKLVAKNIYSPSNPGKSTVHLSQQSQDDVLVEIEEGLTREIKVVPVVVGSEFPAAGSFISYVYKRIPRDSVHVVSSKSVHTTFGALFKNQVIILDEKRLHEVIYDILAVLDKVAGRTEGHDVCALVRKLPEPFTPREEHVQLIWENVSNHGACLISAPGGMGKSSLAAKVAYDFQRFYDSILWVSCTSVADAVNSFRQIVDYVGLKVGDKDEEVIQAVCRWLGNNRKYLLVMDNVDDIDVVFKRNGEGVFNQVTKFGGLAGDVIVTSRDPNIGRSLKKLLKMGAVHLPKWDWETTRSFLIEQTPSIAQRLGDPDEEAAFELLLRRLDGYPLAAEQVAAYLSNDAVSMVECLERMDDVLEEEEGDDEMDQSRAMLGQIVSLQIESIKNQGETGEMAIQLMGILSFFSHENIPRKLLESAYQTLPTSDSARKSPPFSQILDLLVSQSLLRLSADADARNAYSMHGLLHALLRRFCTSSNSEQLAIDSINKVFPEMRSETYSPTDIPLARLLVPHVQVLLHARSAASDASADSIDFDVFSEILEETTSFAMFSGDFEGAQRMMEMSLDVNRKAGSDVHIANALEWLGRIADEKGDYRKAESFLRECLIVKEKVYGTRVHAEVASTLNYLAIVAANEDDDRKAYQLYTESVAIYEAVHGTRVHKDVALLLTNNGVRASEQHDFDKAESLYSESLDIYEKLYGTRAHPEVCTDVCFVLESLGSLALKRGDFFKAEEWFMECLRIQEEVFATRIRPDVAGTLQNLADVAKEKGDFSKAKRLYQESLGIFEKIYNTRQHPDVAMVLRDLGSLASDQGDNVEAAQLYNECLRIQETVYGGREILEVALTLRELGNLAEDEEDYPKASQLLQECLDIKTKIYGTLERMQATGSMWDLGALAQAVGDLDKAEGIFNECRKIEEKIVVDGVHLDAVLTLRSLGESAHDRGHFDEAGEYYGKCLELLESICGTRQHPEVVSVLRNLGRLARDEGEFAEAEEYLNESLAIQENLYRTREHPEVAETLQQLGLLAKEEEDYEKAKQLFDECIAIYEKAYGKREHQCVASNLEILGLVAIEKGDHESAKRMFEEAISISETIYRKREHSLVAVNLGNLGLVAKHEKDYSKAQKLFEEGLSIYEKIYQKRVHTSVATMLHYLGEAAYEQKDYAGALVYLRECLSIRERIYNDPEHSEVIETKELIEDCESSGADESAS